MTQGNLGGLAGALLGGAVGLGMGHLLGTSGFNSLDSFAGGAIAGCFTASMFGLLYDRTTVPEFRKSYRILTSRVVAHEQSDADPRERIAFLGIPIAFATIIVPVVAAILWVVIREAGGHPAIIVTAGVLAAATTFIVGSMTTDHRLLQREIAFNTTPVLGGAQQPMAVPASPASMEPPSPAKGRRDAVICIFGGFLLLGMNHYFVIHDHTYYTKAVFGGPMIIMVGLFGLFEPRIMSRHLPVGKTYPKTVLLLMLVAMAIGVYGGYQIEAWYHG